MLYLGENHQLAFYEVGALLGDPAQPISNPKGSWVLMSLNIRLHSVVDFSRADQQKLVGTNRQELTGDWQNFGGEAPTQDLGAALFNLRTVEGLIYPSARTGGLCLAVFMDRLQPSSRIEFELETNNTIEIFK